MSIIAYDGKTISADSQMTFAGQKLKALKLHRPNKYTILGFVGEVSLGNKLINWFNQGQNEDDYPISAIQDQDAILIALTKTKNNKIDKTGKQTCLFYINSHTPITVAEPYMAWGSGAHFAIGAMANGANSKQAATIACKHSEGCGLPITTLHLNE